MLKIWLKCAEKRFRVSWAQKKIVEIIFSLSWFLLPASGLIEHDQYFHHKFPEELKWFQYFRLQFFKSIGIQEWSEEELMAFVSFCNYLGWQRGLLMCGGKVIAFQDWISPKKFMVKDNKSENDWTLQPLRTHRFLPRLYSFWHSFFTDERTTNNTCREF